MRRECRERFPRHRRWAIPTCITARASRTCRDACRDRQLAVSFEIGGGGKRSRHSRRMRNLQFYVSGKRPIAEVDRKNDPHALATFWKWAAINISKTNELTGGMGPYNDVIMSAMLSEITGVSIGCSSGPRLNIKTVLSTYGDFHVKDKTAVRTSYL